MVTISSVYEQVHNFVKTHFTPEMKANAKTVKENFSDTFHLSQESQEKAAEFFDLNPTKSGIKATGMAIIEKALIKWESFSPEEQAYFKEKFREKAAYAKMNAEEYWNSLSAEEQQEAIARARQSAEAAHERWQSLPE